MSNHPANHRPAEGKVFITTRETGSSGEINNYFENIGGKIIELPMIQTSPLRLSDNDFSVLHQLQKFQWVIFTSANAVKYFFYFLEKSKNNTLPETIQFAVISEKTAEKLYEFGYKADLIGKGPDSEYFSGELRSLFQKTKPDILFPAAELAGSVLQEKLDGVANIVRINLYQTTKPELIDMKVIEQISKNNYELIYFFSPSAVSNFCEITNKMLNCKNLKVACIGQTTQKVCIERGIAPLFVSKKPDSLSLFEATLDFLKSKQNSQKKH